MGSLESEAVFKTRAFEIGVSEAEYNVIKEKNWHAFGRLAFAVGHTPGSPDETPLLKLGETITGVSPTPDDRLCDDGLRKP